MDIFSIQNIKKYTLAYIIATFFVVYIFNIPTLITNAVNLVNEYYYDNILSSLILDYFLIFIYLNICLYFIKKYHVVNFYKKIFIVLLTTFIISNSFYIIFINLPKSNNFFSRWFYKVGIKASFYDCIIILVTYLIYNIYKLF